MICKKGSFFVEMVKMLALLCLAGRAKGGVVLNFCGKSIWTV